MAGNPVFDGWYADPEGIIFDDTYWIFPTYSASYDDQVFFDCFSSKDLVTWKKHSRILDTDEVKWARRAMWAPSIIEKSGKYYLFFGANDIQNDKATGGIGVAIADSPLGPFKRIAKVLKQDPEIGTGAGHHSVIHVPGTATYYAVYHRRPVCETDGNSRVDRSSMGSEASSPLCSPCSFSVQSNHDSSPTVGLRRLFNKRRLPRYRKASVTRHLSFPPGVLKKLK